MPESAVDAAAPAEVGVQGHHERELAAGRFLVQHCSGCGRHVFYPRQICPYCDGLQLRWVAPAGSGTVYSTTTVRLAGTLDCCLVTDGGGAFVMVRADRAADLPRRPVHLLSCATAVWHRQVSSMADLTLTPASESGLRALAAARIGIADIDVVQLYDAFTINTLLFLEDLGFCAKGEGGAFVKGGALGPGGRLAVNTNGGGLSCVHPNMSGAFEVVEAVRQLRGEAGARQVAGAKLALAHGNGGAAAASQATAILGLAETLG